MTLVQKTFAVLSSIVYFVLLTQVHSLNTAQNQYTKILTVYETLVDSIKNNDFSFEEDVQNIAAVSEDAIEHWYNMWIEVNADQINSEEKHGFGYSYVDLDRDTVEELLLLRDDKLLLAVFTTLNGSPVLVDAFWPRYKGCILKNRCILSFSSGGTLEGYFSVKKLKDGQLKTYTQWGYEADPETGESKYYLQLIGNKYKISRFVYNVLSFRFADFTNEKAAEITAKNHFDYTEF